MQGKGSRLQDCDLGFSQLRREEMKPCRRLEEGPQLQVGKQCPRGGLEGRVSGPSQPLGGPV